MTDLPEVLTVREVADALRVTTSTVYRWSEDGTLPAMRVGAQTGTRRTVRFRREDVERLFERSGA